MRGFASWMVAAVLSIFAGGCAQHFAEYHLREHAVIDTMPDYQLPEGMRLLSNGEYRVSDPHTHGNLTVFILRGEDKPGGWEFMTLSDAMAKGITTVYEVGSVNELVIENNSDEDVWAQAGDIVKGGRQDRAFAHDCIIPARAGRMTIAAYCVEHGRWSGRGVEDSKAFSQSASSAGYAPLKKAIAWGGLQANPGAAQSAVWQSVSDAQRDLSVSIGSSAKSPVSASSYQMTLETPEVRKSMQAYLGELQGAIAAYPDAVGYAAVVNGKLVSIDIYANRRLFGQLWPKLIEATSIEAVAAKKGAASAAPVNTKDIEAAIIAAKNAPQVVGKLAAERTALRQCENEKLLSTESFDARPQEGIHQSILLKQ